jgi:3'5'-cyclic nucleotide phosphodiesterase
MPQEQLREIRRLSILFVLATDIGTHMKLVDRYLDTVPAEDSVPAPDSEILCQLLMQTADTSNAARPQDLAERWASRVMNEFFAQGGRERSLGLPISPGMDDTTTTVPKCQIGFISFLVVPRFEALAKRFPLIGACRDLLLANKEFWSTVNPEEYDEKWIAVTSKEL